MVSPLFHLTQYLTCKSVVINFLHQSIRVLPGVLENRRFLLANFLLIGITHFYIFS